MGREELTAEALTLLVGGSDTISNSTCAIIYYLARTPSVQDKLHKELDERLDSDGLRMNSYRHRACIGRNLANLELQIIVASILKRYHFVLENLDEVLPVREGFLRKPIGCRVGMKRREVL